MPKQNAAKAPVDVHAEKIKTKNALLIQTAFIGDAILTTPMLEAFKQHYPNARLTILVKAQVAPLLQEHVAIDEILVITKKRRRLGIWQMLLLCKAIRARRFDVLLAPHKSHRTALLALFSRIPYRVGYSGHAFARFSYHKCLFRDMRKHEIERLLVFLQQGLQLPPITLAKYKKPSLYITPKAKQAAKEILSKLYIPSPPILMAVSSVWPTKRWPPTYFAILAGKLMKTYKRHIIIIGSPQEQEVCQKVLYFIKNFHPNWMREMVHNLSGKINLPELYALLQQSSLLVSNDSAPVHMACAAGLAVVAIFGPTVPELGYAPLSSNSRIAQKELECRPCGLHGHKKCPQQHFRCMKEISPIQILQRVKEIYV